MHFRDLPEPVIRASHTLAEQARVAGLRLFVFGSFARGDARPQSDLDLGVEVLTPRPDTDAAVLKLHASLESWPSIRPVDLVDFRHVSPGFRQEATHHIVEL